MFRLPKRWRVPLGGALVLLLLLLVYPFKITVVPRWRLHVVDETGALLRDVNVTEHWQHYLLESAGHEELLRTDGAGLVDFPERTIRASIASRIIRRTLKLTSRGVAARYDTYASIVAWGNTAYETTVAIYQPDTPTQTEIVIRKK
jgi:hypothetical protein